MQTFISLSCEGKISNLCLKLKYEVTTTTTKNTKKLTLIEIQ